MSLDLDVVIDVDDYSVDMRTGLDTLQGASDTTRLIVESILTDKVPKKLAYNKKLRALLKNSFRGSYGQNFSLLINDGELLNKFNDIGQDVFFELISRFIAESLDLETLKLSKKAQVIYDGFGDNAFKLIEQLRKSSLNNLHQVSKHFGHTVKIRSVIGNNRTTLACLNQKTGLSLINKVSNECFDIEAMITRLNIYTGNGRLVVRGESGTVAFGFSSHTKYKELKVGIKKIFSENLGVNNITTKDNKYITLTVSPVRSTKGDLIKYLIKGFNNE